MNKQQTISALEAVLFASGDPISIDRLSQTFEIKSEDVEKYIQELEKKYEKLDDRRERIINDATREAEKILQDAKSFADETIRNVNKAGNDIKELEKLRSGAREKLNDDIKHHHRTDDGTASQNKSLLTESFNLRQQVAVATNLRPQANEHQVQAR